MKHGTTILLTLATVTLGPRAAIAYCMGWDKSLPTYDPHYYSVSTEFKRAKYVVVARAVGETWLGEDSAPKVLDPPFQFGSPRPWGFDPYLGAFYDLEVQRSFKGTPGARLRVFSENSTARFWLTTGSSYLLFLTSERFDLVGSSLTVDNCGNSGSVEKTNASIRIVGRLSHRNWTGVGTH